MTMVATRLPEKLNAELPWGQSIQFHYTDVTNKEAWVRFNKGSPYLKPMDFWDEDTFKKYYLIASGLIEGNVMVYGKERSGKSLFCYHIAKQRRDLFGIKCTLNRKPGRDFGDYDLMPDDEFKEELTKFNEIVKEIEALGTTVDELPRHLKQALEKLKFYKRTYLVDESYREVDKQHQTNRTKAYGDLVRQHGHLHSLFLFVSPDANDIAGRYIWNRRTHEVSCTKSGADCCKYGIWWCGNDIVKTMELHPSEWGGLWDSYNLIGAAINLKV